MAFDIPDMTTTKITYTTCWGIKLDVSVGGGISISYLTKMSDLLGAAVTFEIGIDVPGSELGIDLLFHYNAEENRLVGFGLSFGMGIGLSPVDLATSRCNTRLIADYQSAVKIHIGHTGSSYVCDRQHLGVISENK